MGIVKLSKAGFKSSTYEKYDSFLAGNPYYAPPSYDSIATVTVGSGGSSSVTFSSIPSTYTDLQIRAIARNTGTGTDTFTALRFNGTGGSTFQYATHYLIGTGSAVVSGANAPSVTDIFSMVTWGSGSSMNSNVFSAGIIDILDYASTSKNKTVRTLTGVDGNGIGQVDLTSGFWNNTNAVNQIELLPQSGSFGQYSKFALYGIKG